MSAAGVDPKIVDPIRLAGWMDQQGLPGEAIDDVEVLTGGTQNVLLRFSRGGRVFVLRRPPPHPREKSNTVRDNDYYSWLAKQHLAKIKHAQDLEEANSKHEKAVSS
ncbi:MAG: hypothetical protein VCB43_03870 [Myxococcota bacterium]